MRKAVKFMVAGSILFLLLVIGFAAYLGWELRPQPPDSALPALVRDLPGPLLTEAQKAFRQRVEKKFPDGVSAQELAAELGREGFGLGRLSEPFTTETIFHAYVAQHGGVCLRHWSVSWHVDQDGRARDIKGAYSADCP